MPRISIKQYIYPWIFDKIKDADFYINDLHINVPELRLVCKTSWTE